MTLQTRGITHKDIVLEVLKHSNLILAEWHEMINARSIISATKDYEVEYVQKYRKDLM
jgi:hypothetical protein